MDKQVMKKTMEETHIKDVGVFYFDRKNREAYRPNGEAVKQGDPLWICPHCGDVAWQEIKHAKHMVEKHPKEALPKTGGTIAFDKIKKDSDEVPTVKKPPKDESTDLISLDYMTKNELLAVAKEEGLDVDKAQKKADLLADIRAKMPVSNKPKYI